MHYILLYIISLAISLKESGSLRKFVSVIGIISISTFALVYAPGSVDYEGYQELFLCAQDQVCIESKPIEASFVLVARIAGYLFGEHGLIYLIAFYVVISSFIKIEFLARHAKHFTFAIFCYVCYNFFVHELTQIRASLSIAFFWLSIEQYAKQKRLPSVLYFCISIFFHYSGIIGIVVYFFNRQTLPKRWLVKCVFIAFFFGVILPNLFMNEFVARFFPDSRLDIYFAATGHSILDLAPLNVAIIVFFLLACMRLMQIRDNQIPAVEVISIKLAFLGLVAWGATWWIPGVGIRTFEFLNSLFPIVASALFFHSRKPISKLIVIGLVSMLFFNLVIRNGTRIDFCGMNSENCVEDEFAQN